MANVVGIGVPVGFVVAGVVMNVFGHGKGAEAAAITLYGCAVLMAISTVIFRAGLASNADRDREEAAREFFDEHGRWPRRGEL